MAAKRKIERVTSSSGAQRDVTATEERMRNVRRRIVVMPNECWVWTGTVSAGGSPQIRRKGKVLSVRRFLYEKDHDLIEGRRLHTTCRDKACVNPDHAYYKDID